VSEPDRQHDHLLPANRLETLGDGVFAIAMTILVLGIQVPQVSEAGLLHSLRVLWPKLASYALSFVMLGVLWIGHYYQFHYIRRTDRTLIWLDLFFLLTITFLPFGAGVLGDHYEDHVAVAMYGATILASGTALLLHWNHATKTPGLVRPELTPEMNASLRKRIIVGMAATALSIAIGLVETRISLVAFLVMPILYMLPTRMERERRARARVA
jgi:uncharacterized membrane protein